MATSAIAKHRDEYKTSRFDIGVPLCGVNAIVAEFGDETPRLLGGDSPFGRLRRLSPHEHLYELLLRRGRYVHIVGCD